MRRASWLAAAALGISVAAQAQPRPPDPQPPAGTRTAGSAGTGEDWRPGGAPDAAAVQRREQLKKQIRALRAAKLIEELSLDERDAGRLLPVLGRYDDETYRLLAKRIEIQRRLRHAETIKDAKTIDRLIDEAIANQRGFWDLEDRRIAEVRKILTPVQTAKLLVVLPDLERRIQSQLRKAVMPRRPGAPADVDDDREPDEVGPRQPARGLRRREAPLAPRTNAPNAPGNTPPCGGDAPCR